MHINSRHALKRGNGKHGNGKKPLKMKTRERKKIIKNEKKTLKIEKN